MTSDGQGSGLGADALSSGMFWRAMFIFLALTGCSPYPVFVWPAGPVGPPPTLLPAAALTGPDASVTDARGAALAAQAAALKQLVAAH